MSSDVESPPIDPGGCRPSRISPDATTTAILFGSDSGAPSVRSHVT
jgi:hypothetical protein